MIENLILPVSLEFKVYVSLCFHEVKIYIFA